MTTPTPGSVTPSSVTPASMAAPVSHSSDPHAWGHIDEERVIWLHAPEGNIRVVQWEAGEPAAGLALYGRKYDDMIVELDLAAKRLNDGKASPDATLAILVRIREMIAARQFVGDVTAATQKADALEAAIVGRREVLDAAKAEQKAHTIARRTAIVEEAERLAESTNWKTTSDRYRDLLEEWKALPRSDKAAEQELWKKFSHARSSFDRRRRAHFATMDAARKESAAAKNVLIERAQALSTSTDWNGTAKAYRDLMTAWKATPRGSRTDDDKLWNRFKAAQDAFFAAKSAAQDAEDAALAENVPAKEALVLEAEALLPVNDLKSAKTTLRSIQDRWDAAGKVPRADKDRLDKRLARVEEAVRTKEQDSWKKSNPEARARAEATAEQFEAGVSKYRKQLEEAKSRGDAAAAAKAQAGIDSMQPLLDAALAAVAEFAG